MKTVYLSSRGTEWTIADEGFEQIAQIIQRYHVCKDCEKPFEEARPLVARNTCLPCFLIQEHATSLTFLGVHERLPNTFKYIDPEGYIYVSTPTSIDSSKSLTATLMHWGFALPQTALIDGEEKELSVSDWNVRGTLTQSVLILENGSHWRGDDIAFLVDKKGGIEQINKRKGKHRDLLQRARNLCEASRDKQGYYHVGKYPHAGLYESDIYGVAAEIASIEFDIQQKLI